MNSNKKIKILLKETIFLPWLDALCIRCLLLNNKLFPKLSALKQQQFIISYGFCGQEFRQSPARTACLCSSVPGTSAGGMNLRLGTGIVWRLVSLTSGSWLMPAIGGMTHMWPALMAWAPSQHDGWIQRVSTLGVRKPDGCPPVYWPNLGSREVSSLLFLLLVKVYSDSKKGNIDPISFWRNFAVIMRDEHVGRDVSVQSSLKSAICPTLFVF